MNAWSAKAAAGEPVVGSCISYPNALGAEAFGKAGFDFLLLDAQHGGVTWENLPGLLQALSITGTPGIVRVGWNDPAMIMRALDLGAQGVVIPMISTPEDAAAAAAATRYPPQGIRSYGPLRNAESPEAANRNVLCLPMIETAEAVKNLEAIISTSGVDGVLVGPMDLALSLGRTPPRGGYDTGVLEAIEASVRLCAKHGKLAGATTYHPSMTAALLERGIQWFTVGSDAGYIQQGAQADLALVRSWLEEHQERTEPFSTLAGAAENGDQK